MICLLLTAKITAGGCSTLASASRSGDNGCIVAQVTRVKEYCIRDTTIYININKHRHTVCGTEQGHG